MMSDGKAANENEQPAHKADPIAAKEAPPHKRKRLVDKAVEATFPASNPPLLYGRRGDGRPAQGHRQARRGREGEIVRCPQQPPLASRNS